MHPVFPNLSKLLASRSTGCLPHLLLHGLRNFAFGLPSHTFGSTISLLISSLPVHCFPPTSTSSSQKPIQDSVMEERRHPLFVRFFENQHFQVANGPGYHVVSLYDSDTRRTVLVEVPNEWGWEVPDVEDPEFWVPLQKATAALAEHLDNLPHGTSRVKVDQARSVVSFDTDAERDDTFGTEYPLLTDYQLPPPISSRTVLRSELTEIRRICRGVDLVSYPPSLSPPQMGQDRNCFVFKYQPEDAVIMWKEIQMLARLPPHPNLVLLDRLVLDEAAMTQVVGFTMRYIPSKTLEAHRPPFKLKWLKQLMQIVDDLNLKHGIIHQDILDRNLIIDPDTDSIMLMDFNVAYRVGVGVTKRRGSAEEAEWAGRDDVKGVLVFLYEYITRDPALAAGFYDLSEVDERPLIDPAKWVKHPSVELDEVAEFYFELMAWVRRRRAAGGGGQLTHYTEAPEPLEWPSVKELEKQGRFTRYRVAARRSAELPYLSWRRPPSSKLDPAHRLLATGRYAGEEEEAAQKAMAKAIAVSRDNPLRKLPPIGRIVSSDDLPPIIIPEEPNHDQEEMGASCNVAGASTTKAGEKLEAGTTKAKSGAKVKVKAAATGPGPRVLRARPKGKRERDRDGDGQAGVVATPNSKAAKKRKRSGYSAKD
ncbi:uncharacterized protein B0T15DRAFT_577693 [Chaetomium strumarium]|uniref:Protein kinase domain-containing protein n=1 Tax=Chaetomium strumarium TaxID=1170767 RepID=A0AAJ0LYQ2_9PEZI|nr:hypothetical protein B0T15DRAFT_577693 [Chaetomium strumarium]